MNETGIGETAAAAARHPDYESEIIELLHGNLAPRLMKKRILSYHENDIAGALEQLKKDDRCKLYNILDAESLANILEYSGMMDEYIRELSIRQRAAVLSHLEAPTAVEVLRQMDKNERTVLLDMMDSGIRQEIMLLSSFDEDEIGSRMTTNYISVRAGISVREAMKELVRQAADNDNISTIYAVDEEGEFVGAVDLKDLIISRRDTELSQITMTSYPYVYAGETVEDCIDRLRGYSEDSIPVLDADNKLAGVLTSKEVMQIVDEEFGEDYAKFAGLSSEEDLKEPILQSVRKRLPWLAVLLCLGLLVSSVVGMFEGVVASLPLIVSFQSLILDMAGNVGTQSLAVTIRVLTDRPLTAKQMLYMILKEARVGLSNGIVLGISSFFFTTGYIMLLKGGSFSLAASVSLCIGVAMLLSMLLSSVLGTFIPLLFARLKIDPAVASGPLITTLNDLTAVVAYYGLAYFLLIRILGL